MLNVVFYFFVIKCGEPSASKISCKKSCVNVLT